MCNALLVVDFTVMADVLLLGQEIHLRCSDQLSLSSGRPVGVDKLSFNQRQLTKID